MATTFSWELVGTDDHRETFFASDFSSDNFENLSFHDAGLGKLISDGDTHILNVVFNCCLCLTTCVLGTAANVVNVVVFIRQGFDDSINVSLVSLAVADLLGLLTLLWRDILYIPNIGDTSLPVDPLPFMYMTGGWPHVYFVRVGSWITAFITFERCLCIAMPLKVKRLITPRKVVFVHVAIYVLILPSIAPLYYTGRFAWKFYPDVNRTLIGLTYSHDRQAIESVVLPINGTAVPVGSLVVNIVCTVILVAKLHRHGKWRQIAASTGNTNKDQSMSVREARIIKMAATISTICIVIVLPHTFIVTWMATKPEFRVDGQLKNAFIVVASVVFFTEAINASVNIVVYYNMSTKFRMTLIEMFKFKSKTNQ